ncbi:MAG: DUF4190 domain-containing protein [Propionibacteriales bacterium]|nr:DUF4190 domain-containing protein [Propionibacteriales bacterium]
MSQSSYDTHPGWGTSYPANPTMDPPAAYPPAPSTPVPYPTAAPAPMNPLAMASLMTGVFGLSLVAVALGHVALVMIKRNQERGTAVAVVGLVLGYLQLVLIAVVMVLAAMDGAF